MPGASATSCRRATIWLGKPRHAVLHLYSADKLPHMYHHSHRTPLCFPLSSPGHSGARHRHPASVGVGVGVGVGADHRAQASTKRRTGVSEQAGQWFCPSTTPPGNVSCRKTTDSSLSGSDNWPCKFCFLVSNPGYREQQVARSPLFSCQQSTYTPGACPTRCRQWFHMCAERAMPLSSASAHFSTRSGVRSTRWLARDSLTISHHPAPPAVCGLTLLVLYVAGLYVWRPHASSTCASRAWTRLVERRFCLPPERGRP